MTKKKPANIQRMKLALFIPWDADGRVYLDNNEFITRETKIQGGSIIKLSDGILVKGKK
jgi:hypothetical protein